MTKSFLSQLSIARRLALGFCGLGALLLVSATMNAVEMHAAGERVKGIVDVHNAKVDLATRMLNQINIMTGQARSIPLMFFLKDTGPELKALTTAEADYQEATKALAGILDKTGTPGERQLLEAMTSSDAKIQPLLMQVVKAGQSGMYMDAGAVLGEKVLPIETQWRAKVAELIDVERELSRRAYVESQSAQRRALAMTGAIVAVGLMVATLLGWGITRSVKRPIDGAIRVAERIAEGDLSSTVKVESNDEIGRLLHAISAMQERLRQLVGQIRQSAESIHTASAEVASGNQDISQRTDVAASSLQRTASSMEQLTGNIRHSAEAAGQANQLASSALAVATRGGEVVSHVVSTMNEINTSSNKIADIIGVIDGIAFQTNLLSLNAAVEAAGAGEHGRGFAVVAGEVRSLAQRSAEAAKEIKALIGTSLEKVETGSRLVQDAGTTMNEIVAAVRRVTDILGKITAAAGEQSSGIEQVNTAVSRLDQMTQQNAVLVEQSTAAAESLKDQSSMLARLVSTFRLDHEGPPA